jgi:hypothetical protein
VVLLFSGTVPAAGRKGRGDAGPGARSCFAVQDKNTSAAITVIIFIDYPPRLSSPAYARGERPVTFLKILLK